MIRHAHFHGRSRDLAGRSAVQLGSLRVTFRNTPEGREALHTRYGELALEARSAAAVEMLENVRDKHLRAAVTWEHLANTGRRIERLRERRAIEQLAAPTAQPGGPAKPASCG